MKTIIAGMLILLSLTFGNKYDEMLKSGKFNEFEQSIKSEPEEIQLYWKGKMNFEKKDYEMATDYFDDLVSLVENNSDYHLQRAKAYLELMKTSSMMSIPFQASKAKNSLVKSVEIDPNNIDARIYLSMYLFNAPAIGGGDKGEAYNHMKIVFSQNRQVGFGLLMDLYTSDEKIEEAKNLLNSIPENERNSNYYYRSGFLMQSIKDYENAFNNFMKSIELDPNNGSSYYQYGRTAIFSKKNIEKGINFLKKYLELEISTDMPQKDSAYWRLGMLYEINGDKIKAKECYNNGLALNNTNEELKNSLENIGE
ncbi:MAG: hypothetical protein JXR48_00985 [Candidatus Delongbacteria bacterium]|nr:hypothetical protein [Candidatus Delongbacteria bacterium]MBN2833518.1 hypothetical protein [Candidatus Delongbacteria bacterium]